VKGAGRAVGEAVDIAVRTDRVRLSQPSDKGLGFNGVVSNVEYRGATLKITVIGAGSDDFTVIASNDDAAARSIAVGDAVSLSWAQEDAILLGRVSA
jgi:putative spermidine/putrescine transport system ATP-binding protein